MPTFLDLNTKIGQWSDVKQHEDFFRVHAEDYNLDGGDMIDSEEEDILERQQ
jgi:hypothetical protein